MYRRQAFSLLHENGKLGKLRAVLGRPIGQGGSYDGSDPEFLSGLMRSGGAVESEVIRDSNDLMTQLCCAGDEGLRGARSVEKGKGRFCEEFHCFIHKSRSDANRAAGCRLFVKGGFWEERHPIRSAAKEIPTKIRRAGRGL